ncbi:LacI family DNA-binding transcriptional regulator [Corynebacterium casei]|uniref:LacI family DNA-binding transcriptional regulator n=1 Tax=Corynebacterium casei TaxID=160386 RepID=UPI003F8EF0EB
MNAKPRRVTLRMIADEVGVDVSTVSRVINSPASEASRWASPSVVERIRDVAISSGYKRNPHAASLRTNRSEFVGVVVPRLQDFVLATVFEGIEESASKHDYSAFVANSLDLPDLHRKRAESLLDRRVDGLIIGDAHYKEPYLDELDRRGVPFVLVNRHAGTRYLSATTDDVLGGELAAEHLLSLGRTQPCIVGGQLFASTFRDRVRGFRSIYRESGIDIPDTHVVDGPFDAAGGRTAMETVLDRGIRPDSIFAPNDFAAIAAMGVLRERGFDVPDDVAVVGYNDTPLAAELTMPLTTISSPMHEMGAQGFELLWRRLEGKDPASVRLVPRLAARASTLGRG